MSKPCELSHSPGCEGMVLHKVRLSNIEKLPLPHPPHPCCLNGKQSELVTAKQQVELDSLRILEIMRPEGVLNFPLIPLFILSSHSHPAPDNKTPITHSNHTVVVYTSTLPLPEQFTN